MRSIERSKSRKKARRRQEGITNMLPGSLQASAKGVGFSKAPLNLAKQRENASVSREKRE